MKKLFILFIVLTITFPVFSQLKDSHVVGTWDYTVETGFRCAERRNYIGQK
jgi:hypothetical protein